MITVMAHQTMAQVPIKKQAILIIDIQQDFTGDKARMPVDKQQGDEMISNINRIVDANRSNPNFEIIYIGNEYRKWDFLNLFRNFAAIEGSASTKLDTRLNVVNDHYFPKREGNAFSNDKLDIYLRTNHVNEIYLAGLKAEACVYLTMKGALKKNYKVNVLTDCVATTSNQKRERMFKKYQLLGANNIKTSTLIGN